LAFYSRPLTRARVRVRVGSDENPAAVGRSAAANRVRNEMPETLGGFNVKAGPLRPATPDMNSPLLEMEPLRRYLGGHANLIPCYCLNVNERERPRWFAAVHVEHKTLLIFSWAPRSRRTAKWLTQRCEDTQGACRV
jgi:hypothetical protein